MASKMTMASLGVMAVGVLMLIVVYTIVPIVGYELDSSITVPSTSNWSYAKNNNIVRGTDLWDSLAGILKVGGIIIVVGGFLGTLKVIRG